MTSEVCAYGEHPCAEADEWYPMGCCLNCKAICTVDRDKPGCLGVESEESKELRSAERNRVLHEVEKIVERLELDGITTQQKKRILLTTRLLIELALLRPKGDDKK